MKDVLFYLFGRNGDLWLLFAAACFAGGSYIPDSDYIASFAFAGFLAIVFWLAINWRIETEQPEWYDND